MYTFYPLYGPLSSLACMGVTDRHDRQRRCPAELFAQRRSERGTSDFAREFLRCVLRNDLGKWC
jgi:hypothetical protein